MFIIHYHLYIAMFIVTFNKLNCDKNFQATSFFDIFYFTFR